MAARFWVGGTGTWDSTTTANWSATSGGAGGASVPGAADDVTIDTASITVTTNYNVSVISVTINASAATLSLGGTLTCSGAITLTQGTFTTNNYNISAQSLGSSNTNVRTISLGSSTVSLSSTTPLNFSPSTNLTLSAGTSSVVCSSTSPTFSGGGLTFNNVSFTNTAKNIVSITGVNTFNNLTITGRLSSGISSVLFYANQTIVGTLDFAAGTNATMRTFVRPDVFGTARTLTCATVSATDVDFRDITIAGAAAPVSGTRLGDCKGNSGITFGAGTTKYWNLAAGGNWATSTGWAASSGGTPAVNDFPLAQDTALFEATGLNSGATVTISANYNIGTVNMSARTSNTMTLAQGTTAPIVYGNWINGTGTTLTGTGTLTFTGRGSQTILSAGRTFTQSISLFSPGGSLTLLDAFISSRNNVGALSINSGTFDANNYNVTLTGSSSSVTSAVTASGPSGRTIAIGSGTWALSGTTAWNIPNPTNLIVTGTGTISLISASSKNFVGGGIQTYPTLNQGGTGRLRVLGSNKFANITNTAIGRVEFDPGQTNIFTAFNLNGVSGNLLQLGANTAAQTTLQKHSEWLMGANSTNAGNNTGLSFTAGGGIDYLSISYINGTLVPWVLVANSQTPNWVGVDDSQTPNWQNVVNA